MRIIRLYVRHRKGTQRDAAAMKRRDVIKKLEASGLILRNGTKHTHILRDGAKVSVLSRQTEIPTSVVRKIERQTGVKLL